LADFSMLSSERLESPNVNVYQIWSRTFLFGCLHQGSGVWIYISWLVCRTNWSRRHEVWLPAIFLSTIR